MGSKPKTPDIPIPDPETISSSTDEQAQRTTELERRRRGGWYSGWRRPTATDGSAVGGSDQTVG